MYTNSDLLARFFQEGSLVTAPHTSCFGCSGSNEAKVPKPELPRSFAINVMPPKSSYEQTCRLVLGLQPMRIRAALNPFLPRIQKVTFPTEERNLTKGTAPIVSAGSEDSDSEFRADLDIARFSDSGK